MGATRVIRPPRPLLEELVARHGHEDTPRVYTDGRLLVRELFWRRLEALLALSRVPGGRVLDLGGGNGILLPTLARRFDEVVCADVDVAMARALAGRAGLDGRVTLREGLLETLALPDAHFDAVVAADVLEHVEDLPPLADELARLLRPGGELLVSLPTENRFYDLGRAVFGYTKPHDHFHDAETVLAALERRLPRAARRHFPLDLAPLGVFLLARLVRPGGAGEAAGG